MDPERAGAVLCVWNMVWFMMRNRRRRLMCLLAMSILAGTVNKDRSGRRLGIPRMRTVDWFEDDAMQMREYEFRNHFRMKRSVFNRLVSILRVPENYNSLTPAKTTGIAIYRMASDATVREVANQFSVSESTVIRCTKSVVLCIISQLGNRIQWPQTRQDAENCARGFLKYGSVWGCVGALDGSLIRLKKNPGDDSYVDRKGHFSIALQAVCDSNTRFLDVFCGCHGSMQDSRVLRLSELVRNNLGSNLPSGFFLVADGGYGIRPWLMIPFRQVRAQSQAHANDNLWLSRCRVRIEQTFGSLKGRWRMLHNVDMSVPSAIRTIVACCILHNFLLDENDEWVNSVPIPPMPLARNLIPQARRVAQQRADAEGVRASLVDQLRRLILLNA